MWDVLQTTQPVTVRCKRNGLYPMQDYGQCDEKNEANDTTACGRKDMRTVKARKNVRLCEKSTLFAINVSI